MHNTCENCPEIFFYSDAEFEQHQARHDNGRFLSAIYGELRLANIMRLIEFNRWTSPDEAKAEIDGLKNLMRHTARSGVAFNKPETGVKVIHWLAGLGAT